MNWIVSGMPETEPVLLQKKVTEYQAMCKIGVLLGEVHSVVCQNNSQIYLDHWNKNVSVTDASFF